VSESRVTWATSVPILVFLELSMFSTQARCMRQTSDVRQTSDSIIA